MRCPFNQWDDKIGGPCKVTGKPAYNPFCFDPDTYLVCKHYKERRLEVNRPWTVCLCGSTKFKKEFMEVAARETLKGYIVLMPHVFTHADRLPNTEEEIALMEELHLRKIDLCDEVIVLDVNGYTGESTSLEVAYASGKGKKINSYCLYWKN